METLETARDSVALVAGQVREGGRDGEPVEGAVVRLRGETEELETETDELGVFLFDAVPLGRYSLSIRHPEYLTVTSTVSVEEPGAPVRVQAALQTDVVALQPIEVTVERPPPFRPGPLRGAYERAERMRAVGLGRVVDREEIDRRSVPSVVDLLSGIGGVQVVPGGRAGERRVSMSRGHLSLWATPREGGDRCYPAVYLGGTRLRVPGTRRGAGHPDEVPQLDRLVSPSQIDLIEVYRSAAEIPAEFSGPEARCGVIAVWTRRT